MQVRTGLGWALATAGLLAVAAAPLAARAQAYKYTDAQGRIHFTDDLGSVPRAYRSQIEEIELTTRRTAEPEGSATGESWLSFDAGSGSGAGAREFDLEAHWQAAQGWLDRWGVALMAVFVLSALVTFGAQVHALVQRRLAWALALFLANVVVLNALVPVYLMLRVEELRVPLRVGLVLLWVSPLVVGALAFRAAVSVLSG